MFDTGRKIIFFSFLFSTIAILGFFIHNIRSGNKALNTPLNKQLMRMPRAPIVDRNNKILAYTDKNGKRIYTEAEAAAQVVGYDSHGMSGLELEYAQRLTSNPSSRRWYFFSGGMDSNPLKTTLNVLFQRRMHNSLGNRNGAVVVFDAETSEVIVDVSHPTHNPNQLDKTWEELSKHNDGPLFNRAYGKYPPASTWKLVTSMLLGKKKLAGTYNCTGSYVVGDKTFHCTHPHGLLKKGGIKDALSVSCNCFFIENGLKKIPMDEFITASKLITKSKLPQDFNRKDYAGALIGQSFITASPMDMTRLCAAIINGGTLQEPKFAKKKETAVRLMDEKTAKELQQAMKLAIQSGTARKLSSYLKKGTAGIKTGTAEKMVNGKARNFTWMVGFARDDKNHRPAISFAVLVENVETTGAEECGPIVDELLSYYFSYKGK